MNCSHLKYKTPTVASGISRKRLKTSSFVLLTFIRTGKRMHIATVKDIADNIRRAIKVPCLLVVL